LVNARMNGPASEILFSGEVLCSSMTRNTIDPVAGPVPATFLWSTQLQCIAEPGHGSICLDYNLPKVDRNKLGAA
jgi:hypothetical protein